MAQQTFKGGVTLWSPPHWTGAVPAINAGSLLDASGEKAAIIGMAPKTGTLDKFEMRLSTVTQAPANGLKFSFQNVDATTGAPDGTPDQYRVVTSGLTSNAWVAPGLMTSDGTDSGTKRSVTQGDLLACVVEFQSFSAGDNLRMSELDWTGVAQAQIGGMPYRALFTGTWALAQPSFVLGLLKYDDGTYESFHPALLPASAINSHTFHSGSTPDEYALYLQTPFPWKCGGAVIRMDLDGDADIVLYDSDGTTALATKAVDKDQRGSAAGANYFARFSSAVTISANTNYRLAVRPATTTVLSIYSMDVNAAAILDAIEGGQNWHHSTRTDGGAWTQTTTRRPFIFPLAVAFDDGAGGAGGGVSLARLAGGL